MPDEPAPPIDALATDAVPVGMIWYAAMSPPPGDEPTPAPEAPNGQ